MSVSEMNSHLAFIDMEMKTVRTSPDLLREVSLQGACQGCVQCSVLPASLEMCWNYGLGAERGKKEEFEGADKCQHSNPRAQWSPGGEKSA